MEHFTNCRQTMDSAMMFMLLGSIESKNAVRMTVSFDWKREKWLIPAVYPIPGGLVVDVVRKLPFYRLKNRLANYEKHKKAGFHSPLEQLLMDRYDPFHFYPTGHLLTENYCIDEWYSERFIWNPIKMSPITQREHNPARELVEDYGLDLSNGWIIFRMCFKSELLSFHDQELTLRLEAPDELVPGPALKIEEAGQVVVFRNPLTRKAEKLTVTAIENGVLERSFRKPGPVKYPANYMILHYRLQPEIKAQQYCLMDTQLADVPVQLESCKALAQPYTEEAQPYEPQFSKLTLQDYVTESKNHAAYSSLTHYPRLSMEWQFVAIRKERTDICVRLKKD